MTGVYGRINVTASIFRRMIELKVVNILLEIAVLSLIRGFVGISCLYHEDNRGFGPTGTWERTLGCLFWVIVWWLPRSLV